MLPPSELTTMNLRCLEARSDSRKARKRLKGPIVFTPKARRKSAGMASLALVYGGLIPALAMRTSIRSMGVRNKSTALMLDQATSLEGSLPLRSGSSQSRTRVEECEEGISSNVIFRLGVAFRTQAMMTVLGRKAS